LALEPDELTAMIKSVRACETALGEQRRDVIDEEEELRKKGVRHVYSSKNLKKGHVLTEDDLLILRPGHKDSGIPASAYDRIVGREINTDIQKQAPIHWKDIVD